MFNLNSLTVTSYENALEQALQIIHSVLFRKVIKVLLFFVIILGRLKGIYFGKQADENKKLNILTNDDKTPQQRG